MRVALAALPVVLSLVVFAGSLTGGWVYDDEQIILRNTLVQEDRLLWTALTSDLFAARSPTGEPSSPYWRPVTVLWYVANHRLFGVSDAGPWHAGNVLLNAIVTLLAYLVMRRVGVGPILASAGVCVLAVHPSRVETVAWVSGVPDILAAAFMLGALLTVLAIADRGGRVSPDAGTSDTHRWPTWLLWTVAILLHALALGAKEIGVLFSLIVFPAALSWKAAVPPFRGTPARGPVKRAAAITAPFIALTALYFVGRAAVLRGFDPTPPEGALGATIRSLPIAGWFYIRQALFPWTIGPTYTIGPVASPGVINFVLPLLAVLVVGGAMVWAVVGPWRNRAAVVGLAIFIAGMVLPGLVGWLPAERMVQDRYLYIPLVGIVMIIVGTSQTVVQRWAAPRRAEWAIGGTLAVSCLALAVQTVRYVPAWGSDMALWLWAVRIEPNSRYAWSQFGTYLLGEGKLDEAAAALDRALAAEETPITLLNRAGVAVRQEDYARAERMLVRLLDAVRRGPPTLMQLQATELLARIVLERDDDSARALALFRDARDRLPFARALIACRIANILNVEGHGDEALAELEAARGDAARERIPQSAMVFYRLGEMYSARGRQADARAAFGEFLRLTSGVADEQMKAARAEAARLVR